MIKYYPQCWYKIELTINYAQAVVAIKPKTLEILTPPRFEGNDSRHDSLITEGLPGEGQGSRVSSATEARPF